MSAPINFPKPTSKLGFQHSSFHISQFDHESAIKRHCLNNAVSVILPNNETIPADVRSLLLAEQTYHLKDLPLSALIARDFIGAFIKKGELCMLSSGTRIDQHNCVAIIPTGKLILNVTKDTYQQLGLEGKPSAFSRKPTKYVIEIDMTQPHFKPGNKPYERVKWAFTERLDLKFDFLCTWIPDDTQICSSSVAVYFANKDYTVAQRKIHDSCTSIDGRIPYLTSNQWEEGGETCDYMDMFEWIGAAVCRCDMNEKEYVSHFSCPEPNVSCPYATLQTHGGMFSSKTLVQLLNLLRSHIKRDDLPWCTMTIHGFTDSPISWDNREHGYFTSGENIYTFVLFPNDEYWLYSAVGSQDIVP